MLLQRRLTGNQFILNTLSACPEAAGISLSPLIPACKSRDQSTAEPQDDRSCRVPLDIGPFVMYE